MVKVDIPDKIYNEIEEFIKETSEFKSVEEYITFVLEELLKEEEPEEQALSGEDEEKVKERLRGLGYL